MMMYVDASDKIRICSIGGGNRLLTIKRDKYPTWDGALSRAVSWIRQELAISDEEIREFLLQEFEGVFASYSECEAIDVIVLEEMMVYVQIR